MVPEGGTELTREGTAHGEGMGEGAFVEFRVSGDLSGRLGERTQRGRGKEEKEEVPDARTW